MAGGAANMQGIGQAGTQGGMPTGGAGQPGTQSGMPMPTNFIGMGGGFPQSVPQAPQQVQQATGFVNPDQRPGLTPEQIRAMTSTPAPQAVQQAAAQQAMPPGMGPQSALFNALKGGQIQQAPQSVQQAAQFLAQQQQQRAAMQAAMQQRGGAGQVAPRPPINQTPITIPNRRR